MVKPGMSKYGVLENEIRFEQDDWALVCPGVEQLGGLDCIHKCNYENSNGIFIDWSYALPDSSCCSGCNASMPDEIQGLFQMANMDQTSEEKT